MRLVASTRMPFDLTEPLTHLLAEYYLVHEPAAQPSMKLLLRCMLKLFLFAPKDVCPWMNLIAVVFCTWAMVLCCTTVSREANPAMYTASVV